MAPNPNFSTLCHGVLPLNEVEYFFLTVCLAVKVAQKYTKVEICGFKYTLYMS